MEYGAPMSAGQTGALQGPVQGQQASTAVLFNGSANAYLGTQVAAPGPGPFTIECWFKASATGRGSMIGYAASTTGMAAENVDRVLFLDSGGKVSFYVHNGAARYLRSTSTYTDGAWHHVAATLGAAGMTLYLDGQAVASDATVTSARNAAGYWRWGGTNLIGLANRPTSDYFVGTLDEVAVYPAQLTAAQVSRHDHSDF